MKKIIPFLMIAASVVLFSCGGKDSSDPKASLAKFLEAMSKKDVKTAKLYATESSTSMLDLMEIGMKADNDTSDSSNDGTFTAEELKTIEYGEPKIVGDKATIAVTNKKKNETQTFQLKKEKDEWKVAFDKQAIMEMGKDSMEKTLNDTMNLDKMDLPADPAGGQ